MSEKVVLASVFAAKVAELADATMRIAELELELQLWAQLNPDRLPRMLKAIRLRKENDRAAVVDPDDAVPW